MDRNPDRMPAAIAARTSVAASVAENGNKPLQAIEEDIARTRVRLSATIDALERELEPHRIIENGAEVLRNSLEPRPGVFRDQVWAYAIPLALIVSGLGWLVMLRRRSYRPDTPSEFGEMPADAVELGATPSPEPAHLGMVEPVEPMSLVDERTAN
jgi:Protein of unknown function (DUF3618)